MIVPLNIRHLFWGWPNRFLARMDQADIKVILIGRPSKNGIEGLATNAQFESVPEGFNGLLWLEKFPLSDK